MVPWLPLRRRCQRGSVPTVAAAQPTQDRKRSPPSGDSTQRPEQRSGESDSRRREFWAIKHAGLLAVIYAGVSIACFWFDNIALGVMFAYAVYAHILVALRN